MTSSEKASPLPPRIALVSIAGFWLLYFVIGSLRSLVVYHDPVGLLAPRVIVSLFSAGITVLLYLVMRIIPATRLTQAILVAAFLAIPAALSYSTLNWLIFTRVFQAETHHPRPHLPEPPATGESVLTSPGSLSVSVGQPGPGGHHSPLGDIADQAFNGYFFYIAWLALFLAMRYATEIGALERRAAALHSSAQAAELRALRYQINPHFLFNSLNALSSLVLAGRQDEAERMIQNLSAFFRSSLIADPTQDISLSSEIALQQLYLDIETVRFPKRLRIRVDVPNALGECCVPALILQPIVENAVKYGVARTTRPVTIQIVAREENGILAVDVEDDGEPLTTSEEGLGVGLANVRDRLAARFGAHASCSWAVKDRGGFSVHLRMPLVADGC